MRKILLTLLLLLCLISMLPSIEITSDGMFLLTRDEMEYAQTRIELAAWYEQSEVPRLMTEYELQGNNLNMQIDSLSDRVDTLLNQRKLLIAGISIAAIAGFFVGLTCGL